VGIGILFGEKYRITSLANKAVQKIYLSDTKDLDVMPIVSPQTGRPIPWIK